MQTRALTSDDIPSVKKFADECIGLNYYSESELRDCCARSYSNGVQCSFLLWNETSDRVLGLRLAFPPGNWRAGKGSKLRDDLWKVPIAQTAYFQSLFLAPEVQGQGFGPALSKASRAAFEKLGARAIVTHAWKESPHNSSIRYLSKLGFATVATHPDYWIDVDYECVRDGKPCRCTAEEMILYL